MNDFTKEELDLTCLDNFIIQSVTDLDVLGLYAFLEAQSEDFKINAKSLMKVFGVSKQKIYRLLNKLIELELLSVTRERAPTGEFTGLSYKLLTNKK